MHFGVLQVLFGQPGCPIALHSNRLFISIQTYLNNQICNGVHTVSDCQMRPEAQLVCFTLQPAGFEIQYRSEMHRMTLHTCLSNVTCILRILADQ